MYDVLMADDESLDGLELWAGDDDMELPDMDFNELLVDFSWM